MSREAKISWSNTSAIFAICLGSMTYGYVLSIISTTLGQLNFYAYFGLTANTMASNYSHTASIVGAINGLLSAGGVFGSCFMAWMSEARGRKPSLVVARVVTLIGCILQTTSVRIAMFLVARFVTGLGAGMLITLVPVFQAEIAPPSTRGFLVAQNGVIIVVAYSIAAWVGVGCYYATNAAFQWRFPLGLQCLWPLLMLVTLPVVPESPRWLLFQDRRDEAWAIISKLHGVTDNQQLFAREEFYQISRQADADKLLSTHESLLDLFRKPSHRKRMFCAFVTMFAAQAPGNLVLDDYSVILYQGLGQKGGVPLILGAAYCTIAAFLNYVCAVLIDRVGRVRLMIIGLSGCVLCLAIESALVAEYAGTQNKAGLSAGVFILFFYIFCYGGCIDANTYVYCAEIFPTHIRAKGMAFSIIVLYLCTIPYLQAAPYAFATIGWKYYLVFICLTTVCIPIIWMTFLETRGFSLEEINEKFGDHVEIHLTHITTKEKAELDMVVESNVRATANAEAGIGNPAKESPDQDHSHYEYAVTTLAKT
ncbi:uncharacterized protein Z519_04116 [Cladophialophora bantiana CBS 173.52]|uniref:Major facilitator superfamily (MFS) profile domain-containing protein n=1 Tax=Cladophialophora bantiana (strain ATCC 10958 / CBS 173.52 / CDC B-1940 / NIH 8579) TaxID=1442370 RepID=A0A0D2F037_CLAB1|nr:uncharacterized protein Z519_04116 [Cladophialophora bantiana CBS 173.52]KIW95531.1 hypothetical protein Z519_04116 [Cladophialophora bantiana CBS 173.52]